MHRGVYAVGHRRLTTWGRFMAAVLACGPGAVLSHRSAARLWNLKTDGAKIEVTTVSSGRTRQRGSVLVHETSDLPKQDRAVLDGIPVTSLARTLVDLAAVVDPTRLGRTFEEAERIRKLDIRAIEAVLLRSNGRNGTKHVRALIAERRPATDTREGLEREFAEIIRQAGLPVPVYNALIGGFLVDAAWMDRRLIVELDGYDFHDRTRKSFEAERVRHTHLQLRGWTVIRLTKGQMPDAASVISALH